MTVNRDLWKPEWPEGEYPSLPCPSCDAPMNFDDNSFEKRTSAHNRDYVDCVGIEVALSRFSGWFVCGDAKCGEVVTVGGDCSYDYDYGEDGQTITVMTLHPKGLHPGPPVITVPADAPHSIRAALTSSYGLLWTSTNACASRLRIVLELILDDSGFPAETPNGKFVSLHERILAWREHYGATSLAQALMAIKWLGNVSSHEASLRLDRVLDAYEILERLLEQLYPEDPRRLDELAASINESKGRS